MLVPCKYLIHSLLGLDAAPGGGGGGGDVDDNASYNSNDDMSVMSVSSMTSQRGSTKRPDDWNAPELTELAPSAAILKLCADLWTDGKAEAAERLRIREETLNDSDPDNDVDDETRESVDEAESSLSLDGALQRILSFYTEQASARVGELQHAFASSDEDGSGVLDYTEFATLLQSLHGGENVTDTEVLEAYHKLQKTTGSVKAADGSAGGISLEEAAELFACINFRSGKRVRRAGEEPEGGEGGGGEGEGEGGGGEAAGPAAAAAAAAERSPSPRKGRR